MLWIHTDDSLLVSIPLVVDYWVTMLVIAVASYSVGPKCVRAPFWVMRMGLTCMGKMWECRERNKRREGVFD